MMHSEKQGSLQNAYDDVIFCLLNVINLISEKKKNCARSRKFVYVRYFRNARKRVFLKFGFCDNNSFNQLPAVFLILMQSYLSELEETMCLA